MKKNPSVDLVLSAVEGYGAYYLKAWRETCDPAIVRLSGVVDPMPGDSALGWLKARNIPVFAGMEEFYRSGRRAHLAVIASPIADHSRQVRCALENDSHVLCEKPLAATVQDIDDLIRARARRALLVGFQWSFSSAVQALKADLMAGRWGRPLRARSLCLWPRDLNYYRRNDWAGRMVDNSGRWVLDSPAQNAMAHFLHNMLFLLGGERETSAVPESVEGELYRVYPIENADSIAAWISTAEGYECLFFGSHAVACEEGPMFRLECENGLISFGEKNGGIVAVGPEKEEVRYGFPGEDDQFKKLHVALAAAREGGPVICGAEAARAQVLCVNGLQDSVREKVGRERRAGGFRELYKELTAGVATLERGKVEADRAGRLWSTALAEAFRAGYREGRLPSRGGVTWASRGRRVDLRRYRYFPGGEPPQRER